MKSLLVLAVLLGLAAAFSSQEYQDAFSSWMREHQKTYSAADFQARFAVFKNNMDYVRDWNAKNTQTVLGLNIFADLTNAEYRSIYLGYRPITHHGGDVLIVSNDTAPAAQVDWRTKGAVTGVKDQGQCGSCWSFSTTGSTEGAHFQKTGNLVSLSEQNLVDCSGPEGNGGCNGGNVELALTYIIKNKGIDTEMSYPYTAKDGTCHFSTSNVGSTVATYTRVPSKSESGLISAANIRPVSVAIDASHNSFQLYKSGVYYESACSQTNLDHAVLVVGYDTDYYLVKNSWGTSWGMDGYIEMSRDKNNNCGIATDACYPTV